MLKETHMSERKTYLYTDGVYSEKEVEAMKQVASSFEIDVKVLATSGQRYRGIDGLKLEPGEVYIGIGGKCYADKGMSPFFEETKRFLARKATQK